MRISKIQNMGMYKAKFTARTLRIAATTPHLYPSVVSAVMNTAITNISAAIVSVAKKFCMRTDIPNDDNNTAAVIKKIPDMTCYFFHIFLRHGHYNTAKVKIR